MRKLFVGGNWKCNLNVEQAKSLVESIYNKLQFDPKKVDVIAAPISIHLPLIQQLMKNNVQVSAQNVSLQGFGAYTGEVTAEHLKDIGVNWAIIGHSERRQYYGETNEIVGKKISRALKQNLHVIGCIGELLEQRESNQTFNVVQQQLDAIKKEISNEEWANLVVAYEPVWVKFLYKAIGTGKVASPEQAQEVHAFIREYLKKNINDKVSNETRIIYGGSVTDKNVKDLVQQHDVDGFLVGGASLKGDFTNIVDACNKK